MTYVRFSFFSEGYQSLILANAKRRPPAISGYSPDVENLAEAMSHQGQLMAVECREAAAVNLTYVMELNLRELY